MLYSKHISVDAGTAEADLEPVEFLVNQGVVYRVWISFPPGCAGLVKTRILHGGHPFLPSEKDSYIRGDSYTFVYPPMYEIKTTPEQIIIETWNEDETYNHTIDIQILVIAKSWILPIIIYEKIVEALKSLFR